MAQKLYSQSRPQVSTLDQTGNVSHHIAVFMGRFPHRDHSQVRLEGGEGIVSDLWLGGGDARDQRRFSCVGIAHQPHIGQQLQLQPVSPFFTLAACFRFPRSLVDGSGKMLVSSSSAAAFGDDDAFIRMLEVMYQGARLVIVECGADRHF